MTRKVLKQEWRDKIIADPELQGKIAKATNMSAPSIKRWAQQNHKMLLLAPLHEALKSYYSLPTDLILTEDAEIEPSKQTA